MSSLSSSETECNKVATSRKRGVAATEAGDSRPTRVPVAKRMRSVTGEVHAEVHLTSSPNRESVPSGFFAGPHQAVDTDSSAEGHRSFSDVGEHVPTSSQPVPPQEVDGAYSESAKQHSQKCIFLLDLFCGTAGVTAAFRACGGDALGIDHIIDKRRVKGPVSRVDLSKAAEQDTVLQWISAGKINAVMLAPPCGTASRAREIPVPRRHRLRKGMQPAPLRSEAWPMGLPDLRGVAKLKVLTANRLYWFTRRVIDLCIKLDIPFICENPRRSIMWLTEPFQNLPAVCRFQHVHSCMYGGKRKKRTSFLMNFLATNLLLQCDGNHSHLPWGLVTTEANSEIKFSTSLETEYPAALCKQLSLAFLERLQQQGWTVPQPQQQSDQSQRMGSGLQPRGTRAPLLLGDFKYKIDIKSVNVPVPDQISQSVHEPFQGIPLHSKLVSSRVTTEIGEDGEKKDVSLSTYGVFCSPFEFLQKALSVEHPLDTPHAVDKSNLRAILFIRDNPTVKVMEFRTRQLRKYTQRAAQLVSDEQQLKKSLDADVRGVLEGKRLLLFKEMAQDANVGDVNLFQELIEGFRLTGEMPQSHSFPAQFKPAQISLQQLKDSSVWAKRMIQSSCRRVGADQEIAKAVYDETQQQLRDGWVKGPFTAAQLDMKYDGCWVPSKRFGVRQGSKIRAVDDFSEFLINASVTATEKLQLFGLDEVVTTARTFVGCDFLLADEGLQNLWCSDEVKGFPGPWRSILGRALDLKSAYKQLARHPEDSWASILAVWNSTTQSVEFYESIALPFGSVCAVMAFNRVARALRLILSELFAVVNTNFFDDFCQLECDALCDSSWRTAELVMRLLGWKISMSEDKRSPFSKQFNLLGAVIDLSLTTSGVVSVQNKPSRISDLESLVENICSSQTVTLSTLETLKGRLLYAAGHTFGRCTQLAIQLISKVSRRGPLGLLDDKLKDVIKGALKCLVDAKPRRVSAWSGRLPVIVFTDGACEEQGEMVTHGATLYDPESSLALMFGDKVPSSWTKRWKSEGRKQLICQAELFPILVAKHTWRWALKERAVLWFIDNNAALAAIIRAYSPVLDSYEMLVINAKLDVELQCLHWYTRVPSKSNLSDEPSRLQFANLERHGFQRCVPQYDLTSE